MIHVLDLTCVVPTHVFMKIFQEFIKTLSLYDINLKKPTGLSRFVGKTVTSKHIINK